MMTIVEHGEIGKYPPFVWARDIRVIATDNELLVSGIEIVSDEDIRNAPDLLRAYRHAISRYGGAKRQGKNAPHIQFANANDFQELSAFVGHYGPVSVSEFSKTECKKKSIGPFEFDLTETVTVAHQSLRELERECLAYRSALMLVSELHRGKLADVMRIRDCVSSIANIVSDWPTQCERERRLRAKGLGFIGSPNWNFTKENVDQVNYWTWQANRERSGDRLKDALMFRDPVTSGHHVVCELLNAFPPLVYSWGEFPVEAPHWDIAAGIRPLLYYLLRREYLGNSGIAICRNSDCRKVFEIERAGQEFCDQDCSRLQRQREYWASRGKKLRLLKTKLEHKPKQSKNRSHKKPKGEIGQ